MDAESKTEASKSAAKFTPGAWQIVRTFNGFRVTRTWTSGLIQRHRTGHLKTEAQALEALAIANGAAA
jgi:hypothetical protein